MRATIFQQDEHGKRTYFDSVECDDRDLLSRFVHSRVSRHIKSLGYGYWQTQMGRGFAFAPNDLVVLASCVKVRGQNNPWIYHRFVVEMPS